ncbi:GNAT family N-acetyltransferase [Nocardioides sp.]|jgi:RimJ/RimL family protein N-acetyltransferase|uniref:GNAT family N-acetyltransferase n=1 Tax=Nocardioides sp. TaxID=35761 RepID=UPI0031FF0AC2|nr:GCN5-related N-acetyltransferase [Nocardioides sp.]
MSAHPTAPTLTDAPVNGASVTIRGHLPRDAQGSFEQCQDPASQAWTTVPIPYSMDDARAFVGEIMPQGWAFDTEWGFAVEYDGRYAGTVSLRNEGQGRAEIAYGSHPWARGTGVMERALRLLLDWGFAERDLRTVIWWAHKGNWASRRLAWRLGFTVEGTVRRWQPQRGDLIDSWVGSLLRGDPREPSSTWLDCPVLVGDGLRLRPMVDTDAPRIAEAGSDPHTQEWLAPLFPLPYDEETARRRVIEAARERLATAHGVAWAVTDGDDRMSAWVALFDISPGRAAELGYWAHPDARGRGLVTRSVPLVARHAKDVLGLERLRAMISPGNDPSARVVLATGFEHTGTLRGATTMRGESADLEIYDKVL